MHPLRKWWLIATGRNRSISDKVHASMFCTDCAKADMVAHRCIVKNRAVRAESRACTGFVANGKV